MKVGKKQRAAIEFVCVITIVVILYFVSPFILTNILKFDATVFGYFAPGIVAGFSFILPVLVMVVWIKLRLKALRNTLGK
ncbi:MAG TPA: hypothetical protein VJH04_03515 [archaeon]|nr:hypothetical protein [archaeon]